MRRIILLVILFLALALRVGYGLLQDPIAPYDRMAGADEWWYLEYSYRQVTDTEMEPLSSAPLYLLWIGSVRWLLQPETPEPVLIAAPPGGGRDIVSVPGVPSAATVIVIRLIQALMGTATCYFIYRIANRVSGDERVGLVAAAVMATSVAMVINASEIMTEPTYIFFLTGALMLYLDAVEHPTLTRLVAVGGLFGLATLTRAPLLLFPVGVALHALLLMVLRRWQWIQLRGIALMLTVYIGICSIWSVYYYARWGEVIIGAKGMSAFLYLGAQGGWQGPEQTDASLGATYDDPVESADYASGAQAVITANPVQYALVRIKDLTRGYMQPHGTVAFPGESLKTLVSDWLTEDRSFSGLLALTRADGFYPKLAIYIVHYLGIGAGIVGIIMNREHWVWSLPVVGFIVYVTLVHLFLLALPRYIFPTLPLWWVFAALVLVRLWDIVQPAHAHNQLRVPHPVIE